MNYHKIIWLEIFFPADKQLAAYEAGRSSQYANEHYVFSRRVKYNELDGMNMSIEGDAVFHDLLD